MASSLPPPPESASPPLPAPGSCKARWDEGTCPTERPGACFGALWPGCSGPVLGDRQEEPLLSPGPSALRGCEVTRFSLPCLRTDSGLPQIAAELNPRAERGPPHQHPSRLGADSSLQMGTETPRAAGHLLRDTRQGSQHVSGCLVLSRASPLLGQLAVEDCIAQLCQPLLSSQQPCGQARVCQIPFSGHRAER